MGKKAVSPVISTVLLILIVIILAVVILLWSRGFIKEVLTKEIGGEIKRTDQLCAEIKTKTILNEVDGSFGFHNIGNVPIYSLNVKLSGNGESEIKKIDPEDGGSVNPGFGTLIKDPDTGDYIHYFDYEEVKIIPILLGKSKSGIKPFECDERNGFVI